MNGRNLLAVAILGVTGCATTGPESSLPPASVTTPATTGSVIASEGESEHIGESEPVIVLAVADDDKPYCTSEKLTGSRIPKRVCLSEAERDKLRETAQGNMRAIRRTPSAVPRQ